MAGNYKAHNILHKVAYWKSRGEDPKFLFQGLDLDYRTITETDWLDFITQVRVIWDNELKKVPDPQEHEIIGYDVYRNRSMGPAEIVAKFASLKFIFGKFDKFASQYSLVEHYEVHNLKRESVVLTYSPKSEVYPYFKFSSPNFIKGFLKAAPRVHESIDVGDHDRVPDAHVELTMNCFALSTVLEREYGYLTKGMNILNKGDLLLIDGKTYAKRINLSIEKNSSGIALGRRLRGCKGPFSQDRFYAPREGKECVNLKNELGKNGTGMIVLQDLFVGNTLVLKKGEIFNAPYCRFDISWPRVPLRSRIRYAFHDGPLLLKTSRRKLLEQIEIADQRYFREMEAKEKELEAREALQEAHNELQKYTGRLEQMVEERTRELRETQAQLIESEKRTLEHRITGGFAHEMRNALAGAQLEFKTTLNYRGQGKPSVEVLKESATNLLKNISVLHEEYQIPREKIASLLLPQLKTIAEIADHLDGVISDVSHDLDRGLSITTQIRDYARMSEFKRGEEDTDMIPLLRHFGDRYQQDFERIGITYSVEGPETAVVRADETHINSIFSNLILNAKDALEEVDSDRSKEIRISIGTNKDENGHFFVITVTDTGPGIPEETHRDFRTLLFHQTHHRDRTGSGGCEAVGSALWRTN
ncbi:MAG: ATP-binding protein [Deltaproteobacteria bacterium]|nr:ATP-binding protein [Deltaproteobacteria bacterium]